MVKQSFPAQVHHHFTEDIQTRQYRSLEVLLGGIESGIKMFQWIKNLKTWTRQARVTEPQLTFGPRHAWRLSSLLVRKTTNCSYSCNLFQVITCLSLTVARTTAGTRTTLRTSSSSPDTSPGTSPCRVRLRNINTINTSCKIHICAES